MRVLLVEDDPDIAEDVARALADAGCLVERASDGESAWFLGDTEEFAAVVLDLGLPKLDGLSVLKRWRAGGRGHPVLILSARGAWTEKVDGIEAGADDYLAKPFEIGELVARVRALVRRSKAQAGPRVVHGPLVMDTAARRAFLRGEPLDLAAREWAVLEVLLSRVEKIVAKDSIIQAVASWGEELTPNAIEVYVSRLRAKLEPAGIRIRTVRGFGYMLEEFRES